MVLLGLPFSATGQGREMKSYYDDEKKVVKEIYTLKSMRSNVLHGTYTSFYKNGNTKTVGQYLENVSYGFWEFYYENGEMRMTGSLKDGKNEGLWEYYYENGQKSMGGDIYGGSRQGPWKMFYQSGSLKSEGIFKDGKKQENWKYYYEKGGLQAVAEYADGIGLYEEYYSTGNIKTTGVKKDGQKDGVWVYFYEDGTKNAEGNFVRGMRDGKWQFMNEQGIVTSAGNYSMDQRTGFWIDYHENGTVSSRGNYDEGQKQGNWKLFYSDGTSKGEGDFINGTGEYREYYKNGNTRIKGELLNGKNHGNWKYYHENGKLEGICAFDNGVGEYSGYYSDGKIKMKGTIRNNERIGIWELYKDDGSIAGYYKPYYENGNPSLWLAKDYYQQKALSQDKGRKVGSYKYKKKKFDPFDSKVNEFRAIIINYNPIAPIFGSFPVGLEYYFQERLGYELLFILVHDPFFRNHDDIDLGQNYDSGWEIAFRQKFYNKERNTGVPYFGHEIRYSNIDYYVNVPDPDIQSNIKTLNQHDNKYEYSVFVGNRYFKSPREGGMSVDMYIGVGIGYRDYTQNFTPVQENSEYFSDLSTSNISFAFRFGINLGIAIRVRK